MEDIDSGLVALAEESRSRNIRSIAIPPLGSGLGGLRWSGSGHASRRCCAGSERKTPVPRPQPGSTSRILAIRASAR